MSFVIREMKFLTEKGLSLRDFYQKEFYEPQPLSELLAQIQSLKEKYLKSKELREAPDTRGAMLEFLTDITNAIDQCDTKVEEGLLDKVAKLGGLFWNFFAQENESDATAEKQKEAVAKQKAWILTGALVFIRYKIRMEYSPQLANAWGFGFWGKQTTDPNNSELYKLLGQVLSPTDTTAYHKLNDDPSDSKPANYFAIVNSITMLNDFIPKLDKKPSYLLAKAHRETQIGEYLQQSKSMPVYNTISTHLDFLEKQEVVIGSIHSVFKQAMDEIAKLSPKAFESVDELKKSLSQLKCHESVKTLLEWSIDQIEKSEGPDADNLQTRLSLMADFISGHAVMGAQYLLRDTFIRQNSEENKPIIVALNEAMGYTKSNKIDFSNGDDVETLVNALKMYKRLVKTYPDKEVHQALWRGVSLDTMIEDAISKLDRAQEPAASPIY